MAIYIPMQKTKEKGDWIWYEFEYDVLNPDPKLDQRGRETYEYDTKKGVFKFNKINDEISFEIGTDPYFFKKKIILIHCLVTMKKCKKENFFPERTCYAA